MTSRQDNPHHPTRYSEAVLAVGAGGLLILDDLPRVPADDPLTEGLVRLGQAATAVGVRVHSTSQFVQPARLRHQLGPDSFHARSVPPFTDDEAADLFRAHGASGTVLTPDRLDFLNGQAAGHPLLLAATAEFLAARGWQYRDQEVNALLRGDHSRAVLPEVIDRLTRTLGSHERELLYRLTLPFGTFDDTDLLAVASVSPVRGPPPRAIERVARSLGGNRTRPPVTPSPR